MSLTRVVELRLCQEFSIHSHVDLCPSTMIKWWGLCCMAQWSYFVHGLCFSQLCGSCYPSILQGDRKELSSRDVAFFGSTVSEKSPVCFQQDDIAGWHQATSKRWHGLFSAMQEAPPQWTVPSELGGEHSQLQSFALRLGEVKSWGGSAGERGINLLKLLCKVQFEALGVLV